MLKSFSRMLVTLAMLPSVFLTASCAPKPIADVNSRAEADEADRELGRKQAAPIAEEDTKILKPDPEEYHPESTPDLAEVANRIVDSTNELRTEKTLAELSVDETLHKTAASFAGFMAKTSRYGHFADGHNPAERAKAFEYRPCLLDENIAYAFRSRGFATEPLAKEFFEGWKKSPGHLKNMLDADVTETAVAIAEGEGGYFFAVQLFGRPDSKRIGFKLTNESDAEFEYQMGKDTLQLLPRHTRIHEACRPTQLEFVWREDENAEETVAPAPGEHFVVTGNGNHFELRKK